MKIQQAVKAETKRLALGVTVLTVLMLGVYLILGRMSVNVVLGGAWGSMVAVLNFFFMALTVQKAAEKMNGVRMEPYPEEDPDNPDSKPDEKTHPEAEAPEILQAKRMMQTSYTFRMLMVALLAAAGVLLPFMDSIAVLIPLLFPRIVVTVIGLAQKRGQQA